MNVLLVASDNSISSGAFNSLVFVAKILKEKGINVLVTVPHSGTGENLLKQNEIPYIMIESRDWVIPTNTNWRDFFKVVRKLVSMLLHNTLAYFKYSSIVKKYNIDIIHNNTTYTYIAAKVAKKYNIKLVWHLREFLEEDQNNRIIFKKCGYKLINKADKIICISKKIYQKYENTFDVDKLVTIYNGVDVAKYYCPNKTIFDNDKITMICVGIITEKKGQLELVEAVCKLNSKYNLELNLVGRYSDDIKNKIESIEKMHNTKCVNLLGLQENTTKFYENSDISFMCSANEAFGRVTVEAMMAGCLVIASNTGANPEIITDEKNGLIYEHNNIEDLLQKIEYAINNIEMSRKLAANGQKHALDKFTAEKNASEILELYKDL